MTSPQGDEQRIHAEAGSSVYAVQCGDMHVHDERPAYRFEPPAIDRAARLGRSNLCQLSAWRDDPASGLSVLLVCGTDKLGGFAAASADESWTVWMARHAGEPIWSPEPSPYDGLSDLIVIVEVADRWPIDDLQLLLLSPVLWRPPRTRALLTSRSPEGWWLALRHRLAKAGVRVGGTVTLQSAADE